MTEEHRSSLPEWKRLLAPALGAALLGILLCALGAWIMPEQFFRAYLVAFLYWLGIGLGSLALLMVQHVTGGRWGLVLRRLLEAGSKTLPLSALLFVPLVFGLEFLYAWSDPEVVAHDELIRNKEIYLNVPFFLGRAAFYFAIWIILSFALNRLSVQQDLHPAAKFRRRMRMVSAPGLALYGLTVTFAAIDWVMSLEPHWFSSIFGVVLAVSQILAAMAFSILVLHWLTRQTPVAEAMKRETWGDLGNLLLAFTMLWAYMGFSQFFLIWSGNLPEETVWYLHRSAGVWEWVAWGLIVFQFGLPFALLLSADFKRNPRGLARVAGLIMVMHVIYYYWLVMPAPEVATYLPSPGADHNPHPHGRYFHPETLWLDVAALVAIGGLWKAWFIWCLQSRPLLPERELAALEEVHHA